jgi:hypothetical protein
MDEHLEELFPFYALGVLTEEEKSQVDAYVVGIPAAQARLTEACAVAAVLPYGAKPLQPSSQTKLAVMNRIKVEVRQTRPRPTPLPAAPALSFFERLWQSSQWHIAMPALAGLSMLIAIFAGVWAISVNNQIAQFQQQNLVLGQELSKQNEALTAMSGRIEPLQAENTTLKSELARQGEALAALNEAIEPLKAENVGLKQELAAQAEQLVALDKAVPRPQQEGTVIAALEQELAGQREQLVALNKQVAQLQAVNANLGQELTAQLAVMAEVTAPDVQAMKIAGTETIPQAHGQLIANPGEDKAVLIVSGLPPLQPGLVYQFWLVQSGQPRRAGVFTVDDSGLGLLQVTTDTSIGSYEAMGISIEQADNNTGPSNEMIMLGKFSS